MSEKNIIPQQPYIVKNPPIAKSFYPEFLVVDHGDGVYLYDAGGKRYLDFGAGIAVNALGYGNKDIAELAARQMEKLIHISNLFTTQPALDLIDKLVAAGPFAAVQFGNSGTEANEAAIKYARLYAHRKKGPGHHKLLCFRGAFHGRTLGALSVTPTASYQEPFEPLLPGVVVADYNDPAGLEKLLDDTFAGVIVEVLQGEGGLVAMTKEFAATLNRLCRKHDIILVADEVQTGLGRLGAVFASGLLGLEPDIITLAKPLAAGLPLSATLIPAKVNDLLKPGDHGTTFAGGPVTTAVAAAIWDRITAPAFLATVRRRGEFLAAKMEELRKRHPIIREIRGLGLLRGFVLDLPAGREAELIVRFLGQAREQGLIVLRTGKNVVRLAPPLVIEEKEIEEGIAILDGVFQRFTTD